MTDIEEMEVELQAVIARLDHARRSLDKGDLTGADALWPRLEQCASRFKALDSDQIEATKPVILALLDELERTIAAFGMEHHHLGERLRTTSRSMTAGAAYRQAEKL